MNKRRVAVVYQVLQHYREPLFELLTKSEKAEYVFLASPVNDINDVKTIDPSKAQLPLEQGGLRWHLIQNRLFGKRFIWQRGVIGEIVLGSYSAIVFLGNASYLSTWVAAILARILGKRVLMWSHGFRRREVGLKGYLRSSFYRLSNGMLLYGHRAKHIMEGRGFHKEDLYVVYNSLDYDAQISTRKALIGLDRAMVRARYFSEPAIPTAIFVGRLVPTKEIWRLIDACARLEASGRPLNVLIVGEGPSRAGLASLAAELHVSHRVYFYGGCYEEAELGALFMSSDTCVCPGDCGLLAIHSLAYGVPVVTHDNLDEQKPEVEAVVPGVTGVLYSQGDQASLVASILGSLALPASQRDLSIGCREIIDAFYNPAYQVKVIEAAVAGEPAEDYECDTYAS